MVRRWIGVTLAAALVVGPNVDAKADTSAETGGSPPLVCGDSKTELPSYPDRGISIPDIALPPAERHPAVDFSAADIATIRARASGAAPDPHGIYARDWQRISSDLAGGTTGGVSADDRASRLAKAAGFAYVVTGDRADLDTAAAALATAFTTFDKDDQYISAQLTNYAQAYDDIAADLDPQRDAAARAAVKRGAQWLADWLTGNNPQGSNPRPHNHRSKVATALGLWSLVFAGDPAAGAWLALSVDQLNSVYRYMFSADGVYLDGYAYYWTFQFFHALPFFYAARSIAGVDVFPALQPVFEWMVRDSTPEGYLANIEDSWIKLTWTAVVAQPYLTARTRLSRSAPLGQILQWRFFNQDWTATQYPDNWTGAGNQAYLWPDELAHIDQSITETAPDTGTLDYYSRGGNSTVMRSDWRYNDPATRWVMFYGAPQSNNHDHCDVMEVLLNAENTVLLNDDGYGPTRFSGRAGWLPSAQHNVVTMDGAGSNDVFDSPVNLDGTQSDYAEKLAYFDQTTPGVPGTAWWSRGVLFAAQDYVVIADRVHAPSARTWDAYLHVRGDLVRSGPQAVWTTAPTVWGPAAKLYALVLPGSASTTERLGQDNLYGTGTGPYDVEANHYLQSTQTGTDGAYLTIAVARSATAAAPVLTDLSRPGLRAATVAYDGHLDTVVQADGAVAQAGSVTTDAGVAWVRTDQARVTGFTAAGATTLTAGGAGFTASSPISVVADQRRLPIWDLQAAGPLELTVDGVCPVAFFAGRPVLGRVAAGRTTFHLPGSGRLLLPLLTIPAAGRTQR